MDTQISKGHLRMLTKRKSIGQHLGNYGKKLSL